MVDEWFILLASDSNMADSREMRGKWFGSSNEDRGLYEMRKMKYYVSLKIQPNQTNLTQTPLMNSEVEGYKTERRRGFQERRCLHRRARVQTQMENTEKQM